MKLGRIRPADHQNPSAPHRRIKLSKYVEILPAVPPDFDYSPAAAGLSNPFLNDSLGDCVIAAGYHGEGIATGNAGNPFIASDGQITADYSAIGGYVPGDPSTDSGCDEATALTYWQTSGFANGTKLLGFCEIDGSNWNEVSLAAYLFEELMITMEIPDAILAGLPSIEAGFVWAKGGAPDPNNGHAVCVFGKIAVEGSTGQPALGIDSWGLKGAVTRDFVGYYCTPAQGGGVYALLTPDVLAKGQSKAPNGIDWTALQADLESLGTDGRGAAPKGRELQAAQGPVSRDAIQAAITIALSRASEPMTRIQAIQSAVGALIARWPAESRGRGGEGAAGAGAETRRTLPGAETRRTLPGAETRRTLPGAETRRTLPGAETRSPGVGQAPAPQMRSTRKSIFEIQREALQMTPQPKNWKRPIEAAFQPGAIDAAPRSVQPGPRPGPRPEPRPGPHHAPRPRPRPAPGVGPRRTAGSAKATPLDAETEAKLKKLGFGKTEK